MDLGADNLRNLAVEQSGGIGHERIWSWLHETELALGQAAEALVISRRLLIYYRDVEKPILRPVWLACLGWKAVHPKGMDLPKHPLFQRIHGPPYFAPDTSMPSTRLPWALP